MKKIALFSLLNFTSILFAGAQSQVFGVSNIKAIGGLVDAFNNNIVSAFSTLFISLCVVAFFYGMAKFILAARNAKEQEMKDGKNFMLWGVIALFVAFSLYGIINFFQVQLQIQDKTTIKIPRFDFNPGASPTSNGGLPRDGLPVEGSVSLCPTNGDAGTNCAAYTRCTTQSITCRTDSGVSGVCNGSLCVGADSTGPGLSNGSACTNPGQCASGNCSNGRCSTFGTSDPCAAEGVTDGTSCGSNLTCYLGSCIPTSQYLQIITP